MNDDARAAWAKVKKASVGERRNDAIVDFVLAGHAKQWRGVFGKDYAQKFGGTYPKRSQKVRFCKSYRLKVAESALPGLPGLHKILVLDGPQQSEPKNLITVPFKAWQAVDQGLLLPGKYARIQNQLNTATTKKEQCSAFKRLKRLDAKRKQSAGVLADNKLADFLVRHYAIGTPPCGIFLALLTNEALSVLLKIIFPPPRDFSITPDSVEKLLPRLGLKPLHRPPFKYVEYRDGTITIGLLE